MKTYTKADEATAKFIGGIMQYYHKPLAAAELTMDILMASNDGGDAVTFGGYPALAVIRKNSLAERAAGSADARLTIDANYWDNADKAQRTALIDHELTHLVLSQDDSEDAASDGIKRDDLGRPVLKLRKHDFQSGGFLEVIERHGAKAVEGQQIAAVRARLEQMSFDWQEAEIMAAQGGVAIDEHGEVLEPVA